MIMKIELRILIVLSVLTLISNWGYTGDWTTGRYNYYRNARSDEALPNNLDIAWKWKSQQPPRQAWYGPARWDAYASIRNLRSMRNYDLAFDPIIVGDYTYWGSSSDNSLYCVSIKTGIIKWRMTAGGAIRLAPTFSDGKIYFGSDDGYVYALSADTGTVIWKYSPTETSDWILNNGHYISRWPCRVGVVVDNGIVYAAFSLLPWKESYLCALNAETGKISGTGTYKVKHDGMTLEGLPVFTDKLLVYPQGRVPPVMFNRKNGEKTGILNSKNKGYGGTFLVYDSDIITYGPGPGHDKTWNMTKFALQGKNQLNKGFPNANMMIFDGDKAYALTDKSIYAVNKTNSAKRIWHTPLESPYTFIMAGKTIYVGVDGAVVAIDTATGQQLWKVTLAGRVYTLTAGKTVLMAGTDLGMIYCLRNTKKEVGSIIKQPPRKKIIAPPVITDKDLYNGWIFSDSRILKSNMLRDEAGHLPVKISGEANFGGGAVNPYIKLDGSSVTLSISDDISKINIISNNLSVAAWVRVDAYATWGGIIGAYQDNGQFERGWILGYNDKRFSFGIATGNVKTNSLVPRINYMKSSSEFTLGQWYCVIGTYDGTTMQLYVNGTKVAESTARHGNIAYPASAYYEIGAYHDKDENIKLTGMINEVRVYDTVLMPDKIETLSVPRKYIEPPVKNEWHLPRSPTITFLTPSSAKITFWTDNKVKARVDYSWRDNKFSISDTIPKLKHILILNNIPHNRMVSYNISTKTPSGKRTTKTYTLDTLFNFTRPKLANAVMDRTRIGLANKILHLSKQSKGICVVAGGDWRLARELARMSDFHVVCVTSNAAEVNKARKELLDSNSLYGTRVEVQFVAKKDKLPILNRSITILVMPLNKDGSSLLPMNDAEKLVMPFGGVAVIYSDSGNGHNLKDLKFIKKVSGRWKKGTGKIVASFTRGALTTGAGVWTHQYGLPNNSGYGGETLDDATVTTNLTSLWIGRPGPRFRIGRNGRGPAPLAISGRLFVLGNGRILGMNAYTGTILWTRALPGINKFNIPREGGNWCADKNNIYIPAGAECMVIDAATGSIKRIIPMPEKQNDKSWGYIARAGGNLFGSVTKISSAYRSFWGHSGWYDYRKSDALRSLVCSSALFAIDLQNMKKTWMYKPTSGGVIMNPTITIGNGRIYFMESENPKLQAENIYRFTGKMLFEKTLLVALDAKTGKTLWKKPVVVNDDFKYYIEAVYLAYGSEYLTLFASRSDKSPLGTCFLTVFNATDGSLHYKKSFDWAAKDHGGHLNRPVIVNDRLFIRPKAMDLQTGKDLAKNTYWGGCGTYIACKNALIMRSSVITLWHLSGDIWQKSGWHRLRPGCWMSLAPACGMLLAPEGGGGCSCGIWIETSVGFAPRNKDK